MSRSRASSCPPTASQNSLALDVAGVCFHVQLPAAASRLDGENEDLDAFGLREEALNRPFEGLEAYRGR